jgi:hypothetical protein
MDQWTIRAGIAENALLGLLWRAATMRSYDWQELRAEARAFLCPIDDELETTS